MKRVAVCNIVTLVALASVGVLVICGLRMASIVVAALALRWQVRNALEILSRLLR